jgi:hypothetical protein
MVVLWQDIKKSFGERKNLKTLRDRAGVARWAHNPKAVCSNHTPATMGAPGNALYLCLSTSMY